MKEPITYEVWVKSRPLVVQERAYLSAQLCWQDADGAIARAKQLHEFYPNIDYVVRECDGDKKRIVFDTTKDDSDKDIEIH